MYKLLPNDWQGNSATCLQRLSDNAFIPMDESNTDYQAYLAWVAQGNTPLSAENE